MQPLFLILSLLISLLSMPVVASESDHSLQQAKELQLASSPTWLALLHYKKEVLSNRFQSQADDANFFLAANGKTQPEEELIADLQAFMRPPQAGHAQCLFPARWFWLKQQLAIPSLRYDVQCPKLESWLERASADELTLVFPSMFLNNPGSMFGHTFLRFDDSKKSSLLSYALNYAAKADRSDSFISYAYKGLTGGYEGVFLTRPYYETVQLYSDTENRDIWEYRLDYSKEEITQLLRHVWEVTDTKFDYFFLKENCSYRLLSLLDAVKPEARLSSIEAFAVYAIPVDTVRVLEDKGLILSREFRPSLASQIEHNRQFLSDEHDELAVLLAEKKLTPAEVRANIQDEKLRAQVIEQAYTILQFRQESETVLADQLLSERSTLPETTKPKAVAISPETGHTSVLTAVGYGETRNDTSIHFTLRPAFHSLLDNPVGYVKGAEINVLDTEINWLTDKEKLQLERLIFFNIVSLNPLSRWHKALSWKFDVSLNRTPLDVMDTTLAFLTSAGLGASVSWSDIIFYTMADFELNVSGRYSKGHSILSGLSGGVVYAFKFGQLKLEYQNMVAVTGADIERVKSTAAVNFNLSRSMSVQFGYELSEYELFEVDAWEVRVNMYF